MELVDLAVQAVDGTKIGASASLYRSHNASELRALLARLERAIVDLEAQNETGTEPTPTALPEEFSTKEAPRGRQLEHGLEPRRGLGGDFPAGPMVSSLTRSGSVTTGCSTTTSLDPPRSAQTRTARLAPIPARGSMTRGSGGQR